MFGLDKGLSPIGIELIANLGYNSVTGIMGFVSNICIGGTALAVATTIKDNKAQKGMIASFGVTALCGVTEPAFYLSLIHISVQTIANNSGDVISLCSTVIDEVNPSR